MRTKKRVVVGVAAAVVMIATGAVAATEEAAAAKEQELAPGMTAEMMEAWAKASSPGPQHEMLAKMAGSWTFEGTFWMAPGAPPMQSSGTAERKMIFDGRILVEKVKSEWQGEQFEGIAMTGFDNVAGHHWSTWMDNMSTGYATSTGACTDTGCEFKGSYNDPMTGGPKHNRTVLTFKDDKEVHENYEIGPDGTEFKSMVLVYTRVEE